MQDFVESNDLKYALVYYTTQSSCQMLGMVPFILLKLKNDQVRIFFQIIVFAEIGTFEFPCLPLLSGRLHVSHGLSANLTNITEVFQLSSTINVSRGIGRFTQVIIK